MHSYLGDQFGRIWILLKKVKLLYEYDEHQKVEDTFFQ